MQKNPFLIRPRFGSMALTIFNWMPIGDAARHEKSWKDKCKAANKLAKYYPREFRKINPSSYSFIDWDKEFKNAEEGDPNEIYEHTIYDELARDLNSAILESDVQALNEIIDKQINQPDSLTDELLSYGFLFWHGHGWLSPD